MGLWLWLVSGLGIWLRLALGVFRSVHSTSSNFVLVNVRLPIYH